MLKHMPKTALKVFEETPSQKKNLLFQVVTIEDNIATQEHL